MRSQMERHPSPALAAAVAVHRPAAPTDRNRGLQVIAGKPPSLSIGAMNSWMRRGVRRGLVLLATGTITGGVASVAAAQLPSGPVVQSLAPDSGARLRGYLTTLGNNPQSLEALIGAGRAALEMGDANAALTFF